MTSLRNGCPLSSEPVLHQRSDFEGGAARQREYGYLASADFAAALARAQVTLVRGGVVYHQYTRRHAAYRID